MNHASPFHGVAARILKYIETGANRIGDAEAGSDEAFDRLCRDLYTAQFEGNAVVRQLGLSRGCSPDRLRHWSQIPALSTLAFKALPVTCLPPEQRARWFESSGTTQGHRGRHYHDDLSLSLYETSTWAWYKPHLCPREGCPDQLTFLTPALAEAPRSSLVHMFDLVARKWNGDKSPFYGSVTSDGSWSLAFERLWSDLDRTARAGRTAGVLGTAFSFVQLLDWLQERDLRIRLPRGSWILQTGGIKGRSRVVPLNELLGGMEAMLGVPRARVVSEYGMCELSSQAYDRSLANPPTPGDPVVYRFPPWARTVLVSPETGLPVGEGETGLVRVFDLANLKSSVAVETQDLGVRRGAAIELLGRVPAAEPRGCSLMAEGA
jgi:hypothetical protein